MILLFFSCNYPLELSYSLKKHDQLKSIFSSASIIVSDKSLITIKSDLLAFASSQANQVSLNHKSRSKVFRDVCHLSVLNF